MNPDKLQYYSFRVSLDNYDGLCNTAEDPFGGIWIPHKTDVYLNVFNMITWINESKTLMELISCTVDVNLMLQNVIQSRNRIPISVNMKCKKTPKNILYAKRIMLRILAYVLARVTNIVTLIFRKLHLHKRSCW